MLSLSKLLYCYLAAGVLTLVLALGEIGPAAEQATPALLKALTDPDTSVRKAAREALEQISPKATAANQTRSG
jgi:HEAT repeat protein